MCLTKNVHIKCIFMMLTLLMDLKSNQQQQNSSQIHTRSKFGKDCVALPEKVLNEILGAAFNSRYMSIKTPLERQNDKDVSSGSGGHAKKRRTYNNLLLPFYVDNSYVDKISDTPAWDAHAHIENTDNASGARQRKRRSMITHGYIKNYRDSSTKHNKDKQDIPVQHSSSHRGIRSNIKLNSSQSNPWDCEAVVKWIDLGENYYPRYLRTIECTKHTCWYGHYSCKPRSFTAKILRKRYGECVKASTHLQRRIGTNGLPGELRELWVWEERPINFCCDCSSN